MPRSRIIIASALLATGLLAVQPVFADPEDVTRDTPPANMAAPTDHSRMDHIEGHVAFLHAELSITPSQESAWQPVAAAMRQDVKGYKDLADKYPENATTAPSAIDSLEERAAFVDLRVQSEHRFLSAFKPLYESMSSAQKAKADRMFANYDE